MLRVSLSRPLVLRHFSTSSTVWNSSRLPTPNEVPKNDENQTEPSTSASTTPEHTSSYKNSPSTSDRPNSYDPLAPYDLKVVKRRIREWTGQAAISVRTRADDFTAHTKTTFSQLGSQLNKVTGYEVIEALKQNVVEQGVCVKYHFDYAT
jgi:sensitive to high expression protein 9